jgi:CubicO group peptidase (beta-lactamase class C family)
MKLNKNCLATFGTLIVANIVGCSSLSEKENSTPNGMAPTYFKNVLIWSVAERDAAFRALDSDPQKSSWNDISAGNASSALLTGPALKLPEDVVVNYMNDQRAAALIIMQDGKVRLERYGLDFDGKGRWSSFSVAKSITATLMGAALKDGYIKSMDEKVSDYIQEMKGSAYDDVNLRQLLTMTSGVKWSEDYNDPNSEVARFLDHKPEPGVDSLVSFMRKLPRTAQPGIHFNYSTGETNLIGIVIKRATKKPLANYLSEKIWVPVGMEQKATWLLSKSGEEISGCCIQATPRDFARFGQFILNGALVDGKSIVPEGWLKQATTTRVSIDEPGRGYGYQWWTFDTGEFTAYGIFGQSIFIDPKRKLVIATNSNFAEGAADSVAHARRDAFNLAVQKAIDDEVAASAR